MQPVLLKINLTSNSLYLSMLVKYAEHYRSVYSFNKATISVFQYFILIKMHTRAVIVMGLLIHDVCF